MSKLTECEKAYIEKYMNQKNPKELIVGINRKGVGVNTVKKYLDYIASITQAPEELDKDVVVKDEVNKDEVNKDEKWDITNLAAKHDRGGVLIMTEGLSEVLDEVGKKNNNVDYRGKIAKIRPDKPTPKGITIDE
jgi:hypothetical protein